MIPTARLQDVAAAFESALSAHFQCSFTPKDESTLHLAIADAFDVVSMGQAKAQELATLVHLDLPRLALPTGDDYLGEFTTTIANTVATPRNWTAPDNAADRIATGAHEVVHVTQHQKGVDAGWWPKVVSHSVLYLCSVATDDAAEYLGKVEADAYATTEAVRVWMGFARRPMADIVASLRRSYAIRPAGAVAAEGVLRSHFAAMDDGGRPNVAVCGWSLDWLAANAPDLQGLVA